MSEENKKNQGDETSENEERQEETGKEVESEKNQEDSAQPEQDSLTDSKEEEKDFGNEDDDDLPEDVKKKLEKKKSEKAAGSKAKKGKSVRKKKKKKTRGNVSSGQVHIKATYNNTIVTFTDNNGEVISWASAGVAGFKGPKKSTPYAAQIIAKIAIMKAKQEYGFKEASVFVKGVGMGRESVIRTLNAQGIFVNAIKDVTPIPHNGCRPKKPRRV